MSTQYLDFLKSTMQVEDPLMEYHAVFDQELILRILSELEKKMDSFGEKLKVTRKAFNIVTESLQNIAKYAKKNPQHTQEPVFVLDRQNSKYQIGSGNLISKEDVSTLKSRLEKLNELDWYGVQQAYKDAIRSNLKNEKRDKNSAGLGFIEMARKSGQKLRYDFLALDDTNSFFFLVITIEK